MNASCIGEQISSDEFLAHYERLARNPPWNDLDDKMEYEDMDKQEVLHALYRFRYLKYQFPCQTSKEELLDDKLKSLLDKSEDDFNQEFLEEEEFFRRFEIWRRVTQKSISFEDALEEVYKMNMFPLSQHRMEAASKGGARAETRIRLLPDSGSLSWPRSGRQVCATAGILLTNLRPDGHGLQRVVVPVRLLANTCLPSWAIFGVSSAGGCRVPSRRPAPDQNRACVETYMHIE